LNDGRPDLQGIWDHTDATPLERPAEIKTLIISKEQAAEIERGIVMRAEDRTTPTEPTEFFNARSIKPIRGSLRSSIIIEPKDGHLPGTSLFHKEIVMLGPAWVNSAYDGPEQRDSSERCLGNPASQPPHLYNPGTNLHQIVQTGATIVMAAEVMHDARVIRLNSRHAPASITSWLGDSIGWWEGDTLVVETKFFTTSDRGRRVGSFAYLISPQTVVIERFTRESENELNYVFTVEDPAYYTQPWTGETHFHRSNDRILEYACHEGNYSLTTILQAGRVRDGSWTPQKVKADE